MLLPATVGGMEYPEFFLPAFRWFFGHPGRLLAILWIFNSLVFWLKSFFTVENTVVAICTTYCNILKLNFFFCRGTS